MSETTTTNQPAVKSFRVACSKCNRIGKARGTDRREAARALWRNGWRNEGKTILCPDCMKAGLVTVPHDASIKIPRQVAICPICGEEVTVEIGEWTQSDDGTWVASDAGVHASCITEPDIIAEDYDEWLNGHFSMPYVDWLPVDQKVTRWINDHYRFDMDKKA